MNRVIADMSTKNSEGNCRDKRGEIPLKQIFGEEEGIKSKIELERMIALELSLAGTSPEALGQLCLLSRETKRNVIDVYSLADGSSDLGRTISVEAVIGIKFDNRIRQ